MHNFSTFDFNEITYDEKALREWIIIYSFRGVARRRVDELNKSGFKVFFFLNHTLYTGLWVEGILCCQNAKNLMHIFSKNSYMNVKIEKNGSQKSTLVCPRTYWFKNQYIHDLWSFFIFHDMASRLVPPYYFFNTILLHFVFEFEKIIRWFLFFSP